MFGEILLKDNGIESKLDKIDKKGNSVSKSIGSAFGAIGKVALVAGAALTAGLGLMGKSALEGASSLEGYRNTLNVVMKDTKLAGETFAWAVDFANKTPFETDSVVQATVRLQSYGLKAREVMPAIGDMAGVMNKDIMSAVEAVADAQTGELERMKEFGVTKQMIIDQGNKIMKGKELVNKKGQIVDQDNFNKAMFSLMDEKFKGGMDLQANSFKGLWSTVTGVFGTSLAMMMGISGTGAVVIGGLFDTIKGKIKIVADTLTKWSKDGTIGKISKVVQSAFKTIGSALSTVGKFIINNVIPAFLKLWNWIQPNIPAIQATIKTAFDIIKTAIETTVKVLGDIINWCIKYQGILIPLAVGIIAAAVAFGVITLAITVCTVAAAAFGVVMAFITSPIGIVVIAIGLLVAAGVLLYKNWDTVSAFLSKIWKSIAQVATNVFNGIKDFFIKWGLLILAVIMGPIGILAYTIFKNWDIIKAVTENVWNGIKAFLSAVWNGIVTAVMAIVNPFVSGITNIFNGMKTGLTTIFNGIKLFFTGVWNAIKLIFLGAILLIIDLVTGNFTKLKEDASKIFIGLQAAFSQIWSGIRLIFTGAVTAIAGALGAAWNGIKSTATNAWNGLKNAVSSIMSNTANSAINIFNGVLSFFRNLPGTMHSLGSNMMNSLKNGISSVMSTIRSVVINGINTSTSFITSLPGKALQWGKDFINGLKNGIMSAINGIANAVKNIASTIRGYLHFSTPDEGPLKDYESWMPDFMGGMAKGINANKFKVTDALKSLAGDMKVDIGMPTQSGSTQVPNRSQAVNNIGSKPEQHFHIDKFIVQSKGDEINTLSQLQFMAAI